VGEVESWIYVKGGKQMSWIPEAELPNDIAKLREELRAALMESVRPIQSQACTWCEKDEVYIPMQDCVGCQHSRQDEMKNIAPAFRKNIKKECWREWLVLSR
jgi:hypothetical protein